jgi:hypothetical protein
MNDHSLSGRWRGYYRNRGREFPIEATFEQDEGTLTGTMTDGVTSGQYSFDEATADDETPQPSEDEVRRALLGFWGSLWNRHEPVYMSWEVPPASTIEGTARGQVVRFRKTYQGESRTAWHVADRYWGTEGMNYEIHYDGRLSGRDIIEGDWYIPPDPDRNVPSAEGTFLLRRIVD